jgi:hypothetical protein
MEDGMQDKEEDLDRDPYIYGQCVFWTYWDKKE